MSNYQHVIEDLRLVTGRNGVFDVTVDNTTLYSKDETGRHAEPGEVLALFACGPGGSIESTLIA